MALESYRRKMREVHRLLGGVCAHCGFSDPRALQVDHVDGGGNAERRRIGQHQVMKRVLAGEPGYQLLCANCNWIKLHERRERLVAEE